ncbi:hypothetical protein [Streptomyces violascens]|uniref:Major tail protein n=1 Tax=Streptomyces violascens TaxID=67381 RepID=A0ABQ3QXB2_9ACTN|nr:hypothetical protein [Streptomyces violascens]GGU13288.1 hypothetical protein GCM10010289_38710 [Streptomyces violascens]GHI41921.1 hypothetical protein Sviol_63290 [Streptomyces violascens]
MAKSSGLGWTTASVDDASGTPQAIKNDFTHLQFATPRAVQDITGIDKSAMERLLLLADFSITFSGVFNGAANMSHDVFKTVPSTSVTRTVTLTVNSKTLTNECLFTDYPLTRADSGELTFTAPGVLADGTVPTWT